MVFSLILSLIPTYGNITRLAALVVGMVLPVFKSFEAIESNTLNDDKQWLVYWVCYATLISIETVAWPFLVWIPLYKLVRVGALAWLVLPQFRGAAFVYDEFVRPFLLVALSKANEVPSLEPYLRNFSATGPKDFDALKRDAAAKVDAAVEKSKQPAASAEPADEGLSYMKAHAQ